jgi:hypothetical protein
MTGLNGSRSSTANVIKTALPDTRTMTTIFKSASISFAILVAGMGSRAVGQNVGRGGFGPSPEMQAAAKAQTESATSQTHAYLNDIGCDRFVGEADRRVGAEAQPELNKFLEPPLVLVRSTSHQVQATTASTAFGAEARRPTRSRASYASTRPARADLHPRPEPRGRLSGYGKPLIDTCGPQSLCHHPPG